MYLQLINICVPVYHNIYKMPLVLTKMYFIYFDIDLLFSDSNGHGITSSPTIKRKHARCRDGSRNTLSSNFRRTHLSVELINIKTFLVQDKVK